MYIFLFYSLLTNWVTKNDAGEGRRNIILPLFHIYIHIYIYIYIYKYIYIYIYIQVEVI